MLHEKNEHDANDMKNRGRLSPRTTGKRTKRRRREMITSGGGGDGGEGKLTRSEGPKTGVDNFINQRRG